MTALLDVNVLLALLDADHVHHSRAWDWLDTHIDDGWASCAITENGFIRIISQPRYPHPITPAEAVGLLADASDPKYHDFWPCGVSVTDAAHIDRGYLLRSRQVTDSYLLALAVSHQGTFVTFDQTVEPRAVPGATPEQLVVIP